MTTIGKVDHVPMENNVLQRTYEIEWNIPNFSSLSGAFGNSYSSPSFSFADKSWYLRIYPNGHPQNKSVGCIGLYLYLRKCSSGLPIRIEFTLGLKQSYREKFSEHHFAHTFKKGNCGYGVDGCLCRSELFGKKDDLLPADVITVFCSFKYPKPGETSTRPCIILSENKVFQDFKEFYRKKEDCDIIIKLKGQEFPAHRAILRARSPVFASAYRHATKENTTAIIDVEGCEPFSFSDFLCFLYCGDKDIISVENVFSLYAAGEKYDVQDLREKCVGFMKENLSTETFCETITLALLHSEIELIALATDFFTKHALEITETVEWQSFSENNPTQSNTLLMKALVAKSSNE